MADYGLGQAGFGSSIIGYGQINPVNSTVKKLFRLPSDPTKQGNAAAIDTVTGDVILDPETGIHMGMRDTQQQVYLAIRTLKYSSSVADFGLDFNGKIIQPSTFQKLQDAVRLTLKSLVDQNKISITSINVSRLNKTGLKCIVEWKDLTSAIQPPAFQFSI